MKVIKVSKQGFCNGVKRALDLVFQTVKENQKNEPIYILGELMNNEFVSHKLNELGVITIKANSRKRVEMLEDITSGIVILTAHGVSPEVKKILDKKNLKYVDTTCPFINKTEDKIKSYLIKGYDVIYIGKHNHPESEGIIDINPNKIHLITSLDETNSLSINNEKIFITTQTTIREKLLKEILKTLMNHYPNAVYYNGVCNSTTLRQEALINEITGDLCIVVGDMISSNANELQKIGNQYLPTYLVNSVEEIKKEWFESVKVVTLTSAASTPDELTDSIYEYLIKL